MLQVTDNPFVAGGIILFASAILTLLVRSFARKYGHVAKPKSDRWHKRPTAMLGGVGIFLATLLGYLAFVPKSPESIVIIGSSSWLFIVGLVDDIYNIKPYQKLFGQLVGATAVVGFGLTLPLTGNGLIDIWITVFWIVGITNAVNLLDNMDGLAAGIAAIAASSLAFGMLGNAQPGEVVLVTVFVGALIGFLIFNFNPASIFMGDCGSMFVGFLLSTSVLMGQSGGRSRGIFTILAVPVLILLVPIFDTTLVTVLRKLWGRKASQGGRDHTSHRLVALGLSERSAVLMLYGFAICAGALAVAVGQLPTMSSLALIGLFTAALTIIGVFLSKVKVYEESQEDLAASNNAVFAFLVNVSHKRRIFEVILDAFLITVCYYGAYVFLFGSFEEGGNWELFLNTVPVLLVLKLFAFFFVGVYRGLWRYTTIGDFITFGKGVVIGSILSIVAVLLLYRFQNFSRTVFVLDGILLLFALVGSRMAFRLIREMIPLPHQNEGRRVLIYGAGDGGEMLLRELRKNPDWNYRPVGFVDDDPLKKDKLINGLKVFDANGSLWDVCREQNIQEILISSKKISAEALKRVREVCRDADIQLMRAQIKIEPIDFE
jgi:UDP-GlcNAc:undecaprenyl-phosphate/decaprenyl-phosphate GlcNAc-1-phosphate transferase